MSVPRTIREEMFSPSSREGIIALYVIDQVGWDFPIRLTNHEKEYFSYSPLRSGVVHAGEQYDYAVVATGRPDDSPGDPAAFSVVFEGVVQDLGGLARVSVNALRVSLVHVSLSDPELVVERFDDFLVSDCVSDLSSGTLQLGLKRDADDIEPENTIFYSPRDFPALF